MTLISAPRTTCLLDWLLVSVLILLLLLLFKLGQLNDAEESVETWRGCDYSAADSGVEEVDAWVSFLVDISAEVESEFRCLLVLPLQILLQLILWLFFLLFLLLLLPLRWSTSHSYCTSKSSRRQPMVMASCGSNPRWAQKSASVSLNKSLMLLLFLVEVVVVLSACRKFCTLVCIVLVLFTLALVISLLTLLIVSLQFIVLMRLCVAWSYDQSTWLVSWHCRSRSCKSA